MTRKKKHSTRDERRWRQIARIVGPGLYDLPRSLAHGLYHLKARGGLSDAEIRLAFERCKAWVARAKKNGIAECECGCGMQLPIDAVNRQGQSVWHLDHCKRTRTFRGITHERCNLEIGDGNPGRKQSHADYTRAHALNRADGLMDRARGVVHWLAELQAPGAVLD